MLSSEAALESGTRPPGEPDQVRVGDIVTFTRPDSTQQVTHRVVEVVATSDGARFRTKGDANDIPDDWIVRPSQLVGKVQLALPKLGGFVRLFVGNRRQLAPFMALPAAYLIFDDIRRRRAERRRKALQQQAWADAAAKAAGGQGAAPAGSGYTNFLKYQRGQSAYGRCQPSVLGTNVLGAAGP